MRNLSACLVAAAVMGGAFPAGAYSLIGAGTDSCGTWLEDHHHHRRGSDAMHQDEQWVVGFLSGVGFVHQRGDDPLAGMDANGVWGWITNYCRANPTQAINDAAAAFYRAHPR